MRKPDCLHCGVKLSFVGRRKIQLGQTGWILGDIPNLIAGAMELDIYSCPDCGKVEFYQAENTGDSIPQVKCPNCGKMHDMDYPRCPFCKFDYVKR